MRKLVEKPFTNEDGGVLTYYIISCDSSESKPTENVCDCSIAIETDTGKVYLFNEESSAWVEMFSLTW